MEIPNLWPNRDQAGDSLPNVLQKPSREIIYQGNKEVIKESERPKGHGLHKIIASFQQERTWPGEMNKKALVQEGLLELLFGTGRRQCRRSNRPEDHLVLRRHA